MSGFDELIKIVGLNRSQKKFCKLPVKKNVRVLAPAGSGKTYSLLWRCKYIVENAKVKGEDTPHFLIVAFTKSARLELESRLKNNSEFKDIHATVRTLNAWGWEQIRKPGKELIVSGGQKLSLIRHDLKPVISKYPQIETIFKGNKTINAVNLIDLMDLHKSLGFTHKMNKTEYRRHVKFLNGIGLGSILYDGYDSLFRMEGIQGESEQVREESVAEFFEFWKKAVIALEKVNRFTFEDQKYWARLYLEGQMAEQKSPQGITRYTHVIVDEFQDINPLDMELLNAICSYHGQKKKPLSLTILGDDDQAIFGWRGSSPKYILHPEDYFKRDFVTCVLDTNYRSPKNIVELSNKLLSYNRDRVSKEIKSAAKGRAVIKLIESKKVISSIDSAMNTIHKLLADERFESIALISRVQTSLFPFQILLSSENIEYYVDADIDIYEGEAMQSLQDIIQVIYRAKDDDVDNPVDAFLKICDKMDRYQIANKDRTDVETFLLKGGVTSFSEVLDNVRRYDKEIKKGLSPHQAYSTVKKLVEAKTVFDFMFLVEHCLLGLNKDYSKKELDVHYKEPQFFRLREISRKYGTDFRAFYRDIEKAKKAGESSRLRQKEDSLEEFESIQQTKLHLMTATRSKGHEYDAVIIIDAEDGKWPNSLTDDIEEERRLFYVAVTRAKKGLYIIRSDERLESRFLLETRLI